MKRIVRAFTYFLVIAILVLVLIIVIRWERKSAKTAKAETLKALNIAPPNTG